MTLIEMPVRCKQCNREMTDGILFYKHPKLGFVCEGCPAFEDGGVTVSLSIPDRNSE